MATLKKLASQSPLMGIDIVYNKKRIKFNVFDETQVNEPTLNRELKKHASSYYFLLRLRNRLEYQKDVLEEELEYIEKKLYLMYKDRNNEHTGRVNSDDVAKAKALTHKKYRKAKLKYLEAKTQFNDLRDAVRAYENRKEIMQSLSANLRKEK